MSYYEAGTCALCGRASEHLFDSEWGRVHEDCGYRRASEEQRVAVQQAQEVEQHARDEALRQEGRLQERAAIAVLVEEAIAVLCADARQLEAAQLPRSWAMASDGGASALEALLRRLKEAP